MTERIAEHLRQLRQAQLRRTSDKALAIKLARTIMLAAATLVVVSDLAIKFLVAIPPSYYHHRSTENRVLVIMIALALAYFTPLVRSRSIALSTGLMVGAALGNTGSSLIFARGVPNPFVLHFGDFTLAFNFADACVLAGVTIGLIAIPPRLNRAFASRRAQATRASSWDGTERRAAGIAALRADLSPSPGN